MTRGVQYSPGYMARMLTKSDGISETVYAITDGWAVKVGKTDGKHPTERLRQLQTGNPRVLHLLAYTVTISERRAHQMLANERIRLEWFRPTVRLLSLLEDWEFVDPRWAGVINAAKELMNDAK